MKGAKRYIRFLLIIFLKFVFLGTNGHFGSSSSSSNIDAEEAASSSSCSASELEPFVNDRLNKQDSKKPTKFET